MVVSKSIFLYFYGLLEERFSGTTNNRKEKTLSFDPLSFPKTRSNDKKSTIYSDNSNVNLIWEQQNRVISDMFIHLRSATSFEDPKWTFLKLLRNVFEIIAYTDMWVIETFRLRRGWLWERDILNTKWCARVKQRLAGKRDGRRHSTIHSSENVVMTENLSNDTSFITLISGEGLTSFTKMTIITFLVSTFWEDVKKLQVCQISSSPRILRSLVSSNHITRCLALDLKRLLKTPTGILTVK